MYAKRGSYVVWLATVGCLALSVPTAVHAQEASVPTEEPRSQGIEEIVVTARRRQESLQDTPISISAFSSNDLQARNLEDVSEVGQFTPNVVIDSAVTLSGSSASTSVTIRGVGQTDFTFNADPAVGTYVDGVYVSRSVGGLIDLLDVERIEILRGPQGTLFGKNSTGGAINITTIAPDQTFSGKVGTQIGRYDLRQVNGTLNVPITPTLAARGSLSYTNRDGWVKSLQGGEDFGSVDSLVGRLRVRWEPASNLTADVIADGTRQRQSGLPIVLLAPINPTAVPFAAAFNAAAQPNNACFAPSAITNRACFNSQWLAGPLASNANPDSRSDLDLLGVSGTLSWRLSDQLTLRSISALRTYTSRSTADADGSPLVVFDDKIYQKLDAFSQELQLLGDVLDGRFNWIVGLYYLDEKGTHLEDATSSIGILHGGGRTVNRSKAAFAQGTFDLTPRLSLTAGVRYTDESRTYTPYNAFLELPTGRVNLVPNQPFRTGQDEWTPLVNLAYKASDTLNLYATYSKGFKSGGFSQRISNPLPTQPAFGPEFVTLYEIGAKFQNAAKTVRINGALFQSDYSDVQVLGLVSGVLGAATINAGEARIRGGELELTIVPVPDLRLQGGLGYLDAQYTRLDSRAVGITLASRLPNTPEWSLNATASYRIEIGDDVSLTPNVGWSYQSLVTNNAIPVAETTQPKYSLVNAAATLGLRDDRLRISAGVKNLTDKRYLVSGQNTDAFGTIYGTYGLPRTWYLGADLSF